MAERKKSAPRIPCCQKKSSRSRATSRSSSRTTRSYDHWKHTTPETSSSGHRSEGATAPCGHVHQAVALRFGRHSPSEVARGLRLRSEGGPAAYNLQLVRGIVLMARFVAVDLFSGAGGMSLGARLAGIHVTLAVESDPHAARTYAANHPRTALFNDDIRRLSAHKLRAVKRRRCATIVFGGPPCQGFSYSNARTQDHRKPRQLALPGVHPRCPALEARLGRV